MILSPKAFRFVSDAVSRLTDQRFGRAWSEARPETPLTDAQVEAALHALDREIKRTRAEVERLSSDDAVSDLKNDLMYLMLIDRNLRDRTMPAELAR